MSQQPLAIVGSGMVTGVGLSAPASCCAIRCGINNFQETPFVDSEGEWIVASETHLEQPWRGPEKLARMLAIVVEETFDTNRDLLPTKTPIIVCLAERERPGRQHALNEQVLELTQGLLGFDFDARSMTVSQGRVGGVVALREARKLLYERRIPAVVIAGVDSYLSAGTLKAFDNMQRLLTPNNSNGFVPGDGAAAAIAKRPRASDEFQLLLIGLGFGIETAAINSDLPLKAVGLTQAIKGALSDAGIGMGQLDFRIVDISGELYTFKEASLALARTLRTKKQEFEMWHAADCIGEVGAAHGPSAFNVLWAANRGGYSSGTTALCHFSNDDGKRGAAILTYQKVIANG